MKAVFLKDKTPEQIKSLASHYYNRSIRAEKECDAVKAENRKIKGQIDKLRMAIWAASDIAGDPT